MQIKKIIFMFYILIAITQTVVASGAMPYVENYLAGLERGAVKISKKALSVFETAAVSKNENAMQSLLDYGLKLEQHDIDWLFRCLGFNNIPSSMLWLISKSMFPSQATANITFVSTIYDDGNTLTLMLSLPIGKGRPDQATIDEAYRKALQIGRGRVASLLKPHVSKYFFA